MTRNAPFFLVFLFTLTWMVAHSVPPFFECFLCAREEGRKSFKSWRASERASERAEGGGGERVCPFVLLLLTPVPPPSPTYYYTFSSPQKGKGEGPQLPSFLLPSPPVVKRQGDSSRHEKEKEKEKNHNREKESDRKEKKKKGRFMRISPLEEEWGGGRTERRERKVVSILFLPSFLLPLGLSPLQLP